MRLTTFFACGTLALLACRGSGDDTLSIDAPFGAFNKIQDVQNDAMPPGTAVALHNVVVTAVDTFGDKTGDFWVEEMEGGAYSGIHVFKAAASDVAMLSPGSVIDLTGASKSEFALTSDTSGRTVTELEPASGGAIKITVTGTGTVPAPATVDALAIGQMADPARSAEWEKWEGVLITVTNVSALNSPKQVGGSTPDPTLQNLSITGDAKIETSLAALPAGIHRDDCLGSATGVVDYFFDYLLLPRSTAEITTGGSGCPVAEALCTDSVDNDGNGFSDCADDNCVVTDGVCRTDISISAIQTASMPPTGGVKLTGAIVTSLSRVTSGGGQYNMWVQTATAAAASQGIYVFGTGDDLSGFAVGSKVDIIGTVSEFNDSSGAGGTLTELNALSITANAGAAVTPTPVAGLSIATLTTDVTAEPYESVFVSFDNVKVTLVGTTASHGAGTLQKGGATFEYQSDIIHNYTDIGALNTCYSNVKGIWSYDVYTDMWSLEVMSVTGAGAGTCT